MFLEESAPRDFLATLRAENARKERERLPTLGASKLQKRLYVVLVRRLESVDIAVPKVSLRHDIRSAPSEYGFILRSRQYVSDESCMTTVAICEGMDRDQTMVKTDGGLIGWKGLVFEPISGVAQ